MKSLIYIEWKRVLNWKVIAAFLIAVLALSMWITTMHWNDYEVLGEQTSVSARDNLSFAKESSKGKAITKEYLQELKDKEKSYKYLDKTNVESLVSANYDGKSIADLSEKEMEQFYTRRIANIKDMVEGNTRMHYTEKEKQKILKNAENQTEITMEYAEGWKNINDHIGTCVQLILIFFSFLLIPLFGNDPLIKMQNLYRSTRYGKKRLDHARIVVAYMAGVFFYVAGNAIFVLINFLRFGSMGAGQPIQSNLTTFFSVYHYTYFKQFMVNFGIGMIAVLLTVSMMLLISILADSVIAGSVALAFVWIFFALFGQLHIFVIDHTFINFTPLRMVEFSHYYTGNEVYDILGKNIEVMPFVLIISILIGIIFLGLSCAASDRKRKQAL